MKNAWLYALTFLLAVVVGAGAQIGYNPSGTDFTVTDDLTVGGQIFADNGTASLPAYSFSGDPDSGIYRAGAALDFAVGGVQYMELLAGQLSGPAGSISVPGYGFLTDTNTGMYRPIADQLGFTVGGEDLGLWAVATGTLTATQVRKLSATPVEVIAAPGAGLAIYVETIQWMLDFNSIAYDSVGAGEDLRLLQGSGVVHAQCDNSSCLIGNSASDAFGITSAQVNGVTPAGIRLSPNTAINVDISSGEWAAADNDANGDSPIHYLIRYRIVSTDLS